jgi:hypothetical protein
LQHLENKYGQEFEVVREAKYNSVMGAFSLTARPKENRRVTFAGVKHPNGKIEDTYLSRFWEIQQLEDEMKPLLDEMYPPQNRWEFSLKLYGADSLNVDLKNLPDYQEVRKQYPDKTFLDLDLFLFKDMNESNMDEELEKAYRLIQFFREEGIQKYSIYIIYYEEQLLKERGRDIKVGAEFADYRSHRISVTYEEAETVHTPKDLEKYLTEFPK